MTVNERDLSRHRPDVGVVLAARTMIKVMTDEKSPDAVKHRATRLLRNKCDVYLGGPDECNETQQK